MAGKWGPADVWILIDGYDLTASKAQSTEVADESETDETTGLGDSFREHAPTGLRMGEFSVQNALFDTDTNRSHDAMVSAPPGSPQASARVATVGFAGNTIGEMFIGWEGVWQVNYRPVAQLDGLTRASADYQVTGQRDDGIVLQELEQKSADWNTESAESYDSGASSANGGVGYLQCTQASGFTNFIGTIRDSSDDSTFADLIAFTDNVSAPFAERLTVSGSVDRYLAFDGNVTGTGTITVLAGFARNE